MSERFAARAAIPLVTAVAANLLLTTVAAAQWENGYAKLADFGHRGPGNILVI